MDNRIEPGHCWVTGEEVYEIISRYPQSHPLVGHVAQVGKQLPVCAKITLLLLDGKQMTISVHEDHINELNLNELWKIIHEKEFHEYTHRQFLPHFNPEKVEQAHLNQIKLLCPPIAILDVQTSDEVRVEL